jgi:hypothetical protein|tara:strand:+ start:50 stop:211 length:162 start_codon:yes stop_codon:yes gene_type:complete
MSKHWVETEDNILKENYNLGKSWYEISLLLPIRNEKAVQRRWYYINRIIAKEE